MTAAEHDVVVENGYFFEAPRWRDDRLWFSDFYSYEVYSVRADGSDRRVEVEVPHRPSGIGWLPDGSLVVVSMTDRTVLSRKPDGSLVVHGDPSELVGGHLNDLVVDAAGHVFVGDFGFDLYAGSPVETAAIHRIDLDGSVTRVAEDMWFPNGMVITPDNVLLVGETLGERVSAFDVTPEGDLVNRRVWAEFAPLPATRDLESVIGGLRLASDGCCLDSEGGLWIADAVGARVVRVVEGGEITDQIDPGSPVFACALGGPDLATLYVCAAPDFHADARAAATEARMLAFRVAVPGIG